MMVAGYPALYYPVPYPVDWNGVPLPYPAMVAVPPPPPVPQAQGHAQVEDVTNDKEDVTTTTTGSQQVLG